MTKSNLPQGRSMLVVMQSIMVHVQQLIGLSKAVPSPIILAVDVYRSKLV